MKRVLVATWGNPFQWGEARYRVNCEELKLEECSDVEMKNVSTLPVLLKALRPDKTVILVLDTLANLTLKNEVLEKNLVSYDGVKEDVMERVRWFITNKVIPLVEDEQTRKLLENAEIVVAPGIGEFDNASVEGDVLDFYAFVLKTLAEELPAEDTEVFLDLTHGINFMPVLTYRALKNLLGLLAYLHVAKLHVLNSEPYPQGDMRWKEKILESEVLNIRSIESEELRPKPIYSIFKDDTKRNWSAFISAVTNGFPLAFATFYPRIGEVKNFLDKAFREFEDSIKVLMKKDEAGRDKVHIVREKYLDEDFRTAVKLHYLLRVLKPEFSGRQYPKDEATLDELMEITKKLFAKMPRIGIVVEDQIHELQKLERGEYIYENGDSRRIPGIIDKINRDKRLNGLKKKKGLSYGELRRILRWSSQSSYGINPEPDVRNFIAHSGFEYNLVSVRYKDGKLMWFYSDRGTVRKFLIEALKMKSPESKTERRWLDVL